MGEKLKALGKWFWKEVSKFSLITILAVILWIANTSYKVINYTDTIKNSQDNVLKWIDKHSIEYQNDRERDRIDKENIENKIAENRQILNNKIDVFSSENSKQHMEIMNAILNRNKLAGIN